MSAEKKPQKKKQEPSVRQANGTESKPRKTRKSDELHPPEQESTATQSKSDTALPHRVRVIQHCHTEQE
ncbi:tubby-related protein 1-like isoform X2 [Huso huso]|uniref:Tubby-related protein 1-like isoform X2 n=1 Tax=Huso huso TaxID=61971 RepID=A0ABR0YIM0_HUSHU